MSSLVVGIDLTILTLHHIDTKHRLKELQLPCNMTRDSVVSETTTLVAVSEETPLLQANSEVIQTHPELQHYSNGAFPTADEEATNSNSSIDEDDKPLPGAQIFFLCYCRIVEPIAFFSIFPYINQMILETGGVREEDVGFYSGLIVCLLFPLLLRL